MADPCLAAVIIRESLQFNFRIRIIAGYHIGTRAIGNPLNAHCTGGLRSQKFLLAQNIPEQADIVHKIDACCGRFDFHRVLINRHGAFKI